MVNAAEIRPHMSVVGSCGLFMGNVDQVKGYTIRLTKDSPGARGQHHFLPLEWVESVDEYVHLAKTCHQVKSNWGVANVFSHV